MKQARLGQDGNRQLIVILLWLIVHVFLYLHFGPRLDLFDVKVYLKSASILSETGHLPYRYQFFYVVHIGIISIFDVLFPNTVLPIIIFQCVVSLIAVLSLYAASKKIFNDSDAGLVTAILFLIWWDCITWDVTLMTESLFCSVSCFIIYLLVKYKGRKTQIASVLLLLFISMTIRPTGVIFWIAAFFFAVQTYQVYFKKNRTMKIAAIVAGACGIVVIVLSMFSIWDFTEEYARGNIVTYADQFHDEEIRTAITIPISNKKELLQDHRHPMIKIINYAAKNPGDFFKAAFLKAWYLLSFVRPYYSLSHNVYSVVWMIVVYGGFIKGISCVRLSPVSAFVLTVMVVNILLVSMATVDWDNRFYIPMEPGIACFSGGGLASFIRSLPGKKDSLAVVDGGD